MLIYGEKVFREEDFTIVLSEKVTSQSLLILFQLVTFLNMKCRRQNFSIEILILKFQQCIKIQDKGKIDDMMSIVAFM